ncbi:hypothetical protein ACJMK2_006177 [Sinanodonta woodiana]|uniref:Uncharacterized protein n=1 Tax=Sinanodonta woodiana TaxID=1069815 RepID=A0ABD3VV46_SINWO
MGNSYLKRQEAQAIGSCEIPTSKGKWHRQLDHWKFLLQEASGTLNLVMGNCSLREDGTENYGMGNSYLKMQVARRSRSYKIPASKGKREMKFGPGKFMLQEARGTDNSGMGNYYLKRQVAQKSRSWGSPTSRGK